ncbi:hypothetical protein [Aurantiacibacter gilvus]|uniref:Uncharacterized protein n=1 Tax=Aurantiacibacter gilvus TaxID=3139141 RepID=A0ABU9IGN3_9SPHN
MTRFANNAFAAVFALIVMATSFSAITSVPADTPVAAIALAPALA